MHKSKVIPLVIKQGTPVQSIAATPIRYMPEPAPLQLERHKTKVKHQLSTDPYSLTVSSQLRKCAILGDFIQLAFLIKFKQQDQKWVPSQGLSERR